MISIKPHFYEFLRLIPQGKAVTYKFLAEVFANHPRGIAQLLHHNKDPDKFPCYKIISESWDIWGYALWNDEKIRRLQNDWIEINNNKVPDDCFWKPKLSNYFAWFPLEWKEQQKFEKLVVKLKKAWVGSKINFQKTSSPHMTLRFFWDLSLEEFTWVIQATDSNIDNIQSPLKGRFIPFSQYNNFDERGYFFGLDHTNDLPQLKKYYSIFHSKIDIIEEFRWYHPHITFFKVPKPPISTQTSLMIPKLIDWTSFIVNLNTLRFYCAVDDNYQVPIADITE